MTPQPGRVFLHLGKKLALLSVLISLILVPLLSGYSLFNNYHEHLARQTEQVDAIIEASLPALREALWLGDATLIAGHLQGLKSFKDVVRVQLDWAESAKPPLVFGTQPVPGLAVTEKSKVIAKEFKGRDVPLGTLTLTLSQERIDATVRANVWIILLTQALQVMAVAALILFAYQRLVGERLYRISEFLRHHSSGPATARMPVRGADLKVPDELDQLATEFNHLLDAQASGFLQLQETNAALVTARAAAEAASQAKSTFLANMSHELRTPMNAIMGMASLALRHADDPKLRDQLEKIDRASKHLLHVINDILDISKIEADRLTLEQTTFKLGVVLENIMSLIGHRATEKQLKLFIDLPADLPDQSFVGDPLRLGQILLNLAGNAVKFTGSGSITLRCRSVEDNADTARLRWEVSDTGIGIVAADQARLFTAFEQADGSMTRKYGGTGLGLAISKRLVQMMGGEIGVTSAPGTGSTFWFTVTLGKAMESAAAPRVPAVGSMVVPTFVNRSADEQLLDKYAGTRVLLAEDEPINQEVSRGLLEDAGLQVDLAEDGVQAVAMAKQQRYALILMDMQMPNLNGIDATLAIRQDSLNTATPILAMTANALDEDRKLCLDAGMNDHIAKPVVPDRLYGTLLKWLEKPRA